MKSRNHSFTVATDPQVTATVHYKSNLSAGGRGDLVPVAAVIPEQILITPVLYYTFNGNLQ